MTTNDQEGYIDNDVAISHKKVGDSPYIGVMKDKETGNHVVMHGKADFIIHPLTKKRVNIKDIFKIDRDTKCPKCGEVNGPGVIFRILENGQFIYECPTCKHFTFCEIRKKER